MKHGDNITITHPVHGEMMCIVLKVNKETLEVLTLAGPLVVNKTCVKGTNQ